MTCSFDTHINIHILSTPPKMLALRRDIQEAPGYTHLGTSTPAGRTQRLLMRVAYEFVVG